MPKSGRPERVSSGKSNDGGRPAASTGPVRGGRGARGDHFSVRPRRTPAWVPVLCVAALLVAVATGALALAERGVISLPWVAQPAASGAPAADAAGSGPAGGSSAGAGASAGGTSSSDAATGSTQVEPTQVRLVMAGDILKHMLLVQTGAQADGTYGFDHVFAHVADELSGFDLRVVNQETPAAGTSLGLSGYPSFNAPLEFNDAEAKAGFNVVLKATNHAMDAGYDGIHDELAYWQANYPGVRTLGVVDRETDDATSPYEPYVFEKDGLRVALLNFTYDLNGYPDPKGAVALLDKDHEGQVRAAIQKAKQEADLVVAFPHWGTEYQLTPSDEQESWAKVFAEEGVDLVVGDHPHVIEPVEVLARPDGGSMLCYWSVGNFVSNQNDNQNLVGGLAEVTLERDADGTCHVGDYAFVPVVCHKGTGTEFTTYLLRDYTDELAATNGSVYANNSSCTVEWVDDFCAQVLGSGYDPAAHELRGTVSGAASGAGSGDGGLADAA